MSNTIAYVDNQTLTNIADAVRYKTGTNGKMLLSDIPDKIRNIEGIVPTGTQVITENGEYDVVGDRSVTVDVNPDLRPLSVSENGSYQPDGFDGYSGVEVNVSPEELYPIGTEVVSVYLGRNWQNGRALLLHGTYTSTGDFTETGDESNQSFCPVYIPISPEYTYNKNNYRITAGFWYDENKNFISSFSQNNTSWVSLPTPPDNAKYLRFASNIGWSNAQIAIYRTA